MALQGIDKWFLWHYGYHQGLKWDLRVTASRRCVSQWLYRQRWNDCNFSQPKTAASAETGCLTTLWHSFYTVYPGYLAWVFSTGRYNEWEVIWFLFIMQDRKTENKVKRKMTFSYYLEILALQNASPTNAVFQNILVKQLTMSKFDNLW